MGPRMREDKGGVFTPHPNLPPKGEGRGRRAPTRGAPTGEGGVGWAGLAEGGEAFGHGDFDEVDGVAV